MRKLLPVLLMPLLLAGCNATFTNLTPRLQPRTPNNQYPVEVALSTRQQTLRWSSLRPQIVVGTEVYPMQATPLMTNRWEGVIPVPPGKNLIQYHYKLDYDYNTFGKPKTDSFRSPTYTLRIQER